MYNVQNYISWGLVFSYYVLTFQGIILYIVLFSKNIKSINSLDFDWAWGENVFKIHGSVLINATWIFQNNTKNVNDNDLEFAAWDDHMDTIILVSKNNYMCVMCVIN